MTQMNLAMKYLRLSIAFFLCSNLVVFAQFQIPETPKATAQTSVYDYVNLLSEPQSKILEEKLIGYADSTSTQIVLAVISSTKGENINYLGAQWGEKWGIGQADKDNGILILLAKDDRRIAINTGEGIEGTITDALSKQIIDQVIIPQFKQGNYYAGLDQGADAIFMALNGEFKEDRSFDNDPHFPFETFLPFIIFIVIIIMLSNRNRGKGGGNGGRRSSVMDLWDIIILSNMGRGGSSSGGGFSGGGGFGGGGFGGGFGGGGFGGGGASGGW